MKNSKIIKKTIKKIESGEQDYIDVVENSVFWDAVHFAMDYSDAEIPFKRSFDDYSSKWFNKIENKNSFILWLKELSKAMKKVEIGEKE